MPSLLLKPPALPHQNQTAKNDVLSSPNPAILAGTVTWEEQLAALQRLDVVQITMRKPGDWFTAWTSVRIGGNGGTLRNVIGYGENPANAVRDLWATATAIAPPHFLTYYVNGRRRHVRWDGSDWMLLPDES